MKYIDAELLKAEIEKNTPDRLQLLVYRDIILALIDSLQQEQESVVERFARIVRGNLIGIDKEVQQKFEQLYFEITGTKIYGGYND